MSKMTIFRSDFDFIFILVTMNVYGSATTAAVFPKRKQKSDQFVLNKFISISFGNKIKYFTRNFKT
jgi:hypothetical protein